MANGRSRNREREEGDAGGAEGASADGSEYTSARRVGDDMGLGMSGTRDEGEARRADDERFGGKLGDMGSAATPGIGRTLSRRSTRRQRLVREGEEASSVEADASASEAFGFTFVEQDVTPDLDPQLQHVLLSTRAGRIDPALVQESDDGTLSVDVLAVLRDPNERVPGLNIVQAVGDIVTGSCEVEDIEAVRRHPNVMSLKGATKVEPNMRFSVPEIRGSQKALRDALPPGAKTPDGSGVIVGVVDFGCDYVHENFRKQDGTTRLLFLWDQSGPKNSMSPAGYPYGREFNSKLINDALKSADPYQFLAYDPEEDSHGTHVMDTAAGNGRGTGSPGVAPNADLIFVQLATEALRPDESFGNSRRLMEAVKYIFDKAAQLGRQAVVNLSLGTHGGPHDGSTPVERWFDELLKTPGRAIVISAGNSWQRRSHSSGRIMPGETRTLGWEKFSTDTTTNELEAWYNGNGELAVTLIFPSGQRFGPMQLGAKPRVINDASGQKAGEVIHRAKDPLNGDNVINIFLGIRMPVGIWGIELSNVGAQPVDFHSWIERDDDRRNPFGGVDRNQSKFVPADNDSTHTIGSISCGKNSITVGSYSATVQGRDLSEFTAEGPTRDGKQKPEVSAPGQNIVAAASRSGNGTVPMSGTSMAAPHVAGLVALVMQAANKPLSVAEIRSSIMEATRRNPPSGGTWHSRYGNGRVDCAASVLTQISGVPQAGQVIQQAPLVSVPPGNGGFIHPVTQLFNTMLDRTQNSTVRMKFEIEAEYVAK